MVQIFEQEERPSLGQRFARSFSNVARDASVQIPQHMQQAQQMRSENEAFKKNYGIDLAGISNPEMRKQISGELLKGQVKSQADQSKLRAKEEVAEKEKEGLKGALDWLDENIKYTGTKTIPGFASFTAGGLRREPVQKREEYDKLGFWATDQVYTHFNKGTISESKLNVIKNDLAPRADLSERENKARVSALRRIANLPKNAPSSVVNKEIDKEINAVKKIEKASGGKQERPPLESFFG